MMHRQAASWWRELQPDPDRKRPGDRAALARLRRCATVAEAMGEEATFALFRRVGASGPGDLPAVALAAAVLAHVRVDTPGQVARIVGPRTPDQPDTAVLKPLRFRRLMEASGEDERLTAFRRLVALAGGTLPVAGLAEALLDWSEDRRRRWIYDYWDAGAPPAASPSAPAPSAPAPSEDSAPRNSPMSRFLQLHLLTFFPPANLNRDDTGRPKTAVVGGATRLRLSSQALKRAWRTSDVFAGALAGHMGQRTQRLGEDVQTHLMERQVPADRARAVARSVAGVFGKLKDEKDPNPTRIEQLAFIAPEERAAALALAERAAASGDAIEPKKAGLLRTADTAADIALFGRMLADDPAYNREAAAQVAHAITTHRVTVEDDYYTAVDDLKRPAEDAGAGFLGEAAFGSGVFYLYLCVDRALLVRNLGGDAGAQALAATALGALTEAAATAAPSGKQNSFAAHGRAQYILAERGDAQPRTLAGAFSKAVTGDDLVQRSVQALDEFRKALDAAYGPAAAEQAVMHVGQEGSLAEIVAFAKG